MTREELKKQLQSYSKDDIIAALMLSPVATGFVLEKCQANGSKPKQDKKVQKVNENDK